MRLLKWFKGLTELGHRATVLAVDPADSATAKDDTLCQLMPAQGISCRYVQSPESKPLYRFVREHGRNIFPSLDLKTGWYASALRSLRNFDFHGHDILFTCSAPYSCHLIGLKMKRATGMPWIAYFSDPWADNPLIAHGKRRVSKYNRRLEQQVVEEADRLIFTTPETVDMVMANYEGRYRSKCRVLTHCYVGEWYTRSGARVPGDENRIRIVHVGSLYSERTAIPFLNAVRLVAERKGMQLNFDVYMYGNAEPRSVKYLVQNNLESIVHLCGAVSFLDSLALMKGADYLLLIDAPLKGAAQSIFLPSKLIDYIGSGRPVIGITPMRGASARVLRETGNVVCNVDDASDIAATLEAVNDRRLKPMRNVSAESSYQYQDVVGVMEKIFQELH
jgi:hypothetical protein